MRQQNSKYTFEITGSTPSKKNSKRWVKRGYRTVLLPSEVHEAWYEDACWQIKGQEKPIEPIEKANIVLTIFAKDKRIGDLTNKADSVMDFLVDMEILKDDNWFIIADLHLKFGGIDKENPRAVIEIEVL